MATFPLQSCLMGHLLGVENRRADCLCRRNEPVHDNGSGLRAAVETCSAARAFLAGILRGMDAVLAQLGRQEQALGRARLDAQAAALAFFWIDDYITSRLRCHSYAPYRCTSRTSATSALRWIQRWRSQYSYNSSRNLGWAIWISASARCRTLRPWR